MPRPSVERLIGAPNIPLPSYDPVASPVDTFYQPEPPIPGEAVDNIWLQLATAMQGLAPSLEGFIKEQEKQKKKRDPSKAEKASQAFLKRKTDEQFREEYALQKAQHEKDLQEQHPSVKAQKRMAEYGAQSLPEELDVENARSKYRQQKLALARQYVSMTRAEGAKWLEENQNLFPGVNLSAASRPDFQLHLKKQFGMAWVKEAKAFEKADGTLDTAEVALSSWKNELANAPDKEAWLREFERPIAEALSAEGQSFREGAIRAWLPQRQAYKARAMNEYDQYSANQSRSLAISELTAAGIGPSSEVSSFLNKDYSIAPEGETEEELTKRTTQFDIGNAHLDQFEAMVHEVMARGLHGGKSPEGILFAAYQQITDHYQDIDDDDDVRIADQFLDRMKNIKTDLNNPSSKTFGERYAKEFRDIEERLEDRADKERRRNRSKGTRTDAIFAGWSLLLDEYSKRPSGVRTAADALAAPDDLQSEEEITDWLNSHSEPLRAILAEQLGEKKAEQQLTGFKQELAEKFSRRQGLLSVQVTAKQKEAVEGMMRSISMGTLSKNDIYSQCDTLDIPMGEELQLLTQLSSQESQEARQLDYQGTIKSMQNAVNNAMPRGQLSAAWQTLHTEWFTALKNEFDQLYEKEDAKGKRKLLETATSWALGRFQGKDDEKQKESYDLMRASSAGNDSSAVLSIYGKEYTAKQGATFFINLLPDEIPDPDDSTKMISNPRGGPGNQLVAGYRLQRAFELAISQHHLLRDAAGNLIYGDPSLISRYAPTIIRDIVMGELPEGVSNPEVVTARGITVGTMIHQASMGDVEFYKKFHEKPQVDEDDPDVKATVKLLQADEDDAAAAAVAGALKAAKKPAAAEPIESRAVQQERIQKEAVRLNRVKGQLWHGTDELTKNTVIPIKTTSTWAPLAKVLETVRNAAIDFTKQPKHPTDAITAHKGHLQTLLRSDEVMFQEGARGGGFATPRFDPPTSWSKKEHPTAMPSKAEGWLYALSMSYRGVTGKKMYDPPAFFERSGDIFYETSIQDASDETRDSSRLKIEEVIRGFGLSLDEVLLGRTKGDVPLRGAGALFNGHIPHGEVPLSAGDPAEWKRQRALYDDPKTQKDSKIYWVIKELGLTDKPIAQQYEGRALTEIEVFLRTSA